MEWIEVFVATSQIGLEPVEGVLYQCGLTGLMIHDEADFAEFLENPNREWDYVADELVEEKEELETGITFFLRDNLDGREQLAQIQGALAAVKAEISVVPAAIPPGFILSFKSTITRWAVFRPMPFTVFSRLAFPVLMAFINSEGDRAERIMRAVLPPMPDTEINSRNSSRSCLSINP